MIHPFRRKNLDPRLFAFYAAAVAALALAEPRPLFLAAGIPWVAAGLALRCWGAGHLVKTARLTISGPYSHLRHPLYAGTLLIGLGLCLMAGPRVLFLASLALLPLFFLRYLPRKERVESARLETRHGEAYAAYRAAVPPLLPLLSPWRPPPGLLTSPSAGDPAATWSAERFRENSEAGTAAGVLAAVLLLALRALVFP